MGTRLRPPALLVTLFFALSACGDGSDGPSSEVEFARPAGSEIPLRLDESLEVRLANREAGASPDRER